MADIPNTLTNTGSSEPETLTYDSALENKKLIDSMYYALQGLGEKDLPYDPKTVLDTFLTKKRYIDTNLLSTAKFAGSIDKLDDDDKKLLAYSLQETDKIPSIFSKGSAPTADALGDYLLAGVSDPTNLASAVASIFTFGAAGEAKLAAQGLATVGAKQYLKAKLAAAASKPALAAMGADLAINATGGAAQNLTKQSAEKDLGMRSEIDPEDALLQGIAEGTINAILPITANILTTVPAKAAKDYLSEIPSMAKAGQWIKNNFYPTAGMDTDAIRLVERNSGELVPFQQKATELQTKLDDLITDTFGKTPDAADIDTINKYLVNNSQAVQSLSQVNPEFGNILNDFNSIKQEAYTYGNLSSLNQRTKDIFNLDPNYVRSVPETYYAYSREPFEKFIDRNPPLFTEYKQAVLRDAALPVEDRYFGDLSSKFIDSNGRITLPQDEVDRIILDDMKNRYEPTRRLRKEAAVFGEKSLQIPDAVKQVIGYNNKPALRISDTINGIMTTAARSNLARDLGGDAIRRGLGVSARDEATARSILGKEVTKLVGEVSPIELPLKVIDQSLKDIWVTKEYATQLKTLFDDSAIAFNALNSPALGWAMKTVLGVQNFAKAGKTVYNPLGHIRNAIGAGYYTATSGNAVGLGRAISNFLTMPNAQRMALWDKFESLGLKGTNIDLNQTLRRFGDLTDLSDNSVASSLLGLGKVGRTARNVYGLTDDVAKFSTFLNEEARARKIFDAYDQNTQLNKLIQFRTEMNKPLATADDLIAEEAARKTADLTPVYSRIPKILEKMRTIPILGSFTAYPAERLRNTYNLFKTAASELTEGFNTGNNELIKAGTSRLMQWYTAQGALYTAAYALNEYGKNSELVENMRKYLPEWSKDGAIIVTGKDSAGRPKYINLSYIHPDKDIIELVAPVFLKASRGEDVSKELDQTFLKAAKKVVQPYVDTSLVVQAGSDLLNVAKGDFSKLPNLIKTLEPGTTKLLFDMAIDTGTLRSMGETGSKIETAFRSRPYGSEIDQDIDFVSALKKNGLVFPGMREETFDPVKIMGYTLHSLKRNNEGNWNHLKRDLGNKLADPAYNLTAESVLKDYEQSLKTQYAYQQGLKKLYEDMQNFMPKHEVQKTLNSFGMRGVKPSKKEMNAALSGRFNPLLLSEDQEFWTNINKALIEKTGTSSLKEFGVLRSNLRNLENFYKQRNLKEDPPELNISGE